MDRKGSHSARHLLNSEAIFFEIFKKNQLVLLRKLLDLHFSFVVLDQVLTELVIELLFVSQVSDESFSLLIERICVIHCLKPRHLCVVGQVLLRELESDSHLLPGRNLLGVL